MLEHVACHCHIILWALALPPLYVIALLRLQFYFCWLFNSRLFSGALFVSSIIFLNFYIFITIIYPYNTQNSLKRWRHLNFIGKVITLHYPVFPGRENSYFWNTNRSVSPLCEVSLPHQGRLIHVYGKEFLVL